jgi:hypothetical protein
LTEADSPLTLSPEAQHLADEAIAALGTRSVLDRHPALDMLTSWLEQEGRLIEAITAERHWLHVLTLEELITRAAGLYEGPEERVAIMNYLRERLVRALDGDMGFWGEEYPVHVAAPLLGAGSESRVLGFVFERFDEPVEWDGLFRSVQGYRNWLQNKGYLTSLEQFAGIPAHIVLGLWARIAA